jgi:hypothetical protein
MSPDQPFMGVFRRGVTSMLLAVPKYAHFITPTRGSSAKLGYILCRG